MKTTKPSNITLRNVGVENKQRAGDVGPQVGGGEVTEEYRYFPIIIPAHTPVTALELEFFLELFLPGV
jgi:hypothetical protein